MDSNTKDASFFEESVHSGMIEQGHLPDLVKYTFCNESGKSRGHIFAELPACSVSSFPKHTLLNSGRSFDNDGSILVEMLESWTKKLKMPELRAFGVRDADLPNIVEKSSNKNNPIKLTREEMLDILRSRL